MYWGCWSGQKFGFGVCVAQLRHALIPLASAQPFKTDLGKRYVTDFFTRIKSWDSCRWLTSTWVYISSSTISGIYFAALVCDTPVSWRARAKEPSRLGVGWMSPPCRRQPGAGGHFPAFCMPSTALPPYVTNPQILGCRRVLLRFWRKRLRLVNIARVHRFPLLSNFEGDLIIWSFETKYFLRTKLD